MSDLQYECLKLECLSCGISQISSNINWNIYLSTPSVLITSRIGFSKYISFAMHIYIAKSQKKSQNDL